MVRWSLKVEYVLKHGNVHGERLQSFIYGNNLLIASHLVKTAHAELGWVGIGNNGLR